MTQAQGAFSDHKGLEVDRRLQSSMASSSKGRARYPSGPQRFHNYLNGLQKEYELHSNFTSTSLGSNRFNILVGGLKGEFELMALEIESLQKGKDEFKAKGMYFIPSSWKYFNQLLS